MKWAYFKMFGLCLPEADAWGEAYKIVAICDKAKPLKDGDAKATDLSRFI